jgi:hypothetical protein
MDAAVKLFFALPLLIGTLGLHAQKRNDLPLKGNREYVSVNVIGGDLSALSFNYERLLPLTQKSFVSLKLGAGFGEDAIDTTAKGSPVTYLLFPTHLSFNFGSGKSQFELGMGATFTPDNPYVGMVEHIFFGFRKQPVGNSRFNYRIYLSIPMDIKDYNDFENDEENKIGNIKFFPIGFSVGYSIDSRKIFGKRD